MGSSGFYIHRVLIIDGYLQSQVYATTVGLDKVKVKDQQIQTITDTVDHHVPTESTTQQEGRYTT